MAACPTAPRGAAALNVDKRLAILKRSQLCAALYPTFFTLSLCPFCPLVRHCWPALSHTHHTSSKGKAPLEAPSSHLLLPSPVSICGASAELSRRARPLA